MLAGRQRIQFGPDSSGANICINGRNCRPESIIRPYLGKKMPVRNGWLRTVAPSDFNSTGFDLFALFGCNRRCLHCLLHKTQLSNKTSMSLRLVELIIEWATSSGSPFQEATLLGGEFALHQQAKEVVKLLGRSRCASGKPMRVRIVTNGSAPFRRLLRDCEVVRILQNGCVNVSLEHADPTINDRIRGPRAHQDALAAVSLLRKLQIPFAINTTVCKLNAHGLAELFAWAEHSGAFRVNIHWWTPAGNGRERLPYEQLSPVGWREVIRAATAFVPTGPGFVVDCQQGFVYDDIPLANPGACAIRDRTNLQFYPPETPDSLECRASSCGMMADYAVDGGYIFGPGGLRDIVQLPRGVGTPENARHRTDCGQCPLSDYFTPSRANWPMVCIYHRVGDP